MPPPNMQPLVGFVAGLREAYLYQESVAMSLINPRLCHLWCVCVFSIAKASSFSLGSLVDTGDIHGGGLSMILSRSN